MSYYISQFELPKFVEYYFTSYNDDFDNSTTYSLVEPEVEISLFPNHVTLNSYSEGEIYQSSTVPEFENALTEQPFEGGERSYYENELNDYNWGLDRSCFEFKEDSEFDKVEDWYPIDENYDLNGYNRDYETKSYRAGEENSWDEMKLCESIFGSWPCLIKDNEEANIFIDETYT